jgi:deoxycytidylate deaminase
LIVSSRHIELLEELHVAHAEAARLSKLMIALQSGSAGNPSELRGVVKQWQLASTRTMELHAELRAIIEANRDKDSGEFKLPAVPESSEP